ncbi:MAG TPA: tyrosine-type recombinase/integrase [Microlunatus sp.]|nr:tyrosine-type recombinase/integrase [Microlunatus sp.]
MSASVIGKAGQCRLTGWADEDLANRFLDHLAGRAFATATVRAYAYDVLCFARFCQQRGLRMSEVLPVDVFDWVAWQTEGQRPRSGIVVAMVRHSGAAPAPVNRRVAAVRAMFEYLVMCGDRADNPVPAPRRGQGLRVKSRGMLGHLGPGRRRTGGRLVQSPRTLPESLDRDEVAAFVANLLTHRDRAVALLMLLGGLRAGEVRRLRLTDVDVALRRVRVLGKGGRERVVPIDRPFFTELTAYLRSERPPGLATPECFVVLTGVTAGRPMTEAGMRSVFRHHRATSGAVRVRPHRLRHTYGTELAAAGIDLLVLRDLMGHASPETTAGYVHLSAEHLAAEYAAARSRLAGSVEVRR